MAYKQLKLWFDKELAIQLAELISPLDPEFNTSSFIEVVSSQIDKLELKDRVECIADQLHTHLKHDYTTSIKILLNILGPENENETGMFKEYYWIMPIAKFVEKYGLEYFEISMNAIAEITKRNTGEYTIRPYLRKYPEKTLAQMKLWSKDPNKHIRRLSSEGLRPRLPWVKKLDIFIQNPKPILPIITNLKDDNSKYVQKSVANCINDILKDNLEIGQELVEKWTKGDISKERKWIIKHALRRLVKQNESWAINITT